MFYAFFAVVSATFLPNIIEIGFHFTLSWKS